MNTTPTLEGHGVRLVPLERGHLGALLAAQDATTWQWMSESGATDEQMLAFIERALLAADAGTAQVWTTTMVNPSEPHGPMRVAGCTRLADWSRQHRTGEIGWTWLAPQLRGSGLNARVKLLQLRHCFQELQLRRVALKTHGGNLRSQRAIQKLGAHFEGVFRNHMLMPDGSSRDTHWYSILDSEWQAIEEWLLQRVATEALPAAEAVASLSPVH